MIAKSVNERPEAAAQLDRADYVELDAAGVPAAHGVSLFNRSGLAQREAADWFHALATIDRDAADGTGDSSRRRSCLPGLTGRRCWDASRGAPGCGCSS